MEEHTRERNSTLKRILRILRDPIWQCVGALVSALAILVAYHVFSLQSEVKALQVVILASTSLVEVEQSVAEETLVIYRDQPVTDLSLFQIKVENSGNQVIREEDYAKPIRFVFPPQAEIIEAVILESSPPNIGITVRTEQNMTTLSPVLLNEGDRTVIRFLVSNMPSAGGPQPFTVDARIAGVKEIDITSAIGERETAKGTSAMSGYWAGFVAGFLGAGILGFVLQQLRWARARMRAYKFPWATEQTPEEVIRSSQAAQLNYVFWAMGLIVFLLGIIWLAFQSLS